jgi:hypothetical protein
MSTYTICSLKENRILSSFSESGKKESYNLKKNSKLKKTISLNSSYIVTNNTQELKKTSLSSSQSS